MGRNWNEQERVGRGADDDGVGDQNVVDSDVDNNCDQSGERHDRENDGVAQAPFLMVAQPPHNHFHHHHWNSQFSWRGGRNIKAPPMDGGPE